MLVSKETLEIQSSIYGERSWIDKEISSMMYYFSSYIKLLTLKSLEKDIPDFLLCIFGVKL